jgi:hypothetical protein
MKVIYKITYPKGKIYIGKDSTGDLLRYFGSPDREYLEQDYSFEDLKDFKLRKEILWSSDDVSESDLIKKENELIEKNGSNNPSIGYNLIPKYKHP